MLWKNISLGKINRNEAALCRLGRPKWEWRMKGETEKEWADEGKNTSAIQASKDKRKTETALKGNANPCIRFSKHHFRQRVSPNCVNKTSYLLCQAGACNTAIGFCISQNVICDLFIRKFRWTEWYFLIQGLSIAKGRNALSARRHTLLEFINFNLCPVYRSVSWTSFSTWFCPVLVFLEPRIPNEQKCFWFAT